MVKISNRSAALLLALAALILLLAVAPKAGAHAQLVKSSPSRDAVLKTAPSEVTFDFGEPVEAAFGAVRVYDSEGRRVDQGPVDRPDGPSSIGVGLKPNLPDGSYTATYRVISADSHPVNGGIVFHVGEAARAPTRSVESYLKSQQAPRATRTLYTVARFAGYAALCLLLGMVFFDAFIFGPVVHRLGRNPADAAFAQRANSIEGVGVLLGVVSAATTIVFQAAVGAGVSFFSALNADAVREITETRSGSWMLVRLALWLAIMVVWALSRSRKSRRMLEGLLVLGVLAAQVPALIGHAAVTKPIWLMIELDFLHIAAMSLWVGGLAAAVLALPHATRTLAPGQRTTLLVGVFDRFSLMALVAVAVIVLSGTAQALVQFSAFSELTSTDYGRAILAKIVLLVLALAAAGINRRRSLPQLHAAEKKGSSPAEAGRLLKRALSTELALTTCILVAASLLVGYAPAKAVNAGPRVLQGTLGKAEVQLIVDPARSGANQIHLYLSAASSGAPFTNFKELTGTISRAKPQIGPLELKLSRAGPGHFIDPDVHFVGGGDWTIELVMRTSEFDQSELKLPLKVR